MITFGSRGDLLDGVQTFVTTDDRSTFHDIANYTSVRLNFNLGKADETTEPLYWLNPMDAIIADITKLKDTRVTFNDSDGDGVIDMLDEEENTPEGAPVSVKGVALDSDGDGLKDYEDKEPYSPSKDVDDEGVAKTPDVMAAVEKLVNEKLAAYQPKVTEKVAPPFSFWYLPTVYFDVNQTKIRPVDLGTLATVADVMKANPNLKFVVAGHADPTGSEEYNNKLSYERAKAVVDYLVEKGVDRSQLILVWKGEKENLAEGINEINRRVAIRVATNETEMA
ncbi:MAG: OmpA family protein, partial [Bacteroidetes bacterium]